MKSTAISFRFSSTIGSKAETNAKGVKITAVSSKSSGATGLLQKQTQKSVKDKTKQYSDARGDTPEITRLQQNRTDSEQQDRPNWLSKKRLTLYNTTRLT